MIVDQLFNCLLTYRFLVWNCWLIRCYHLWLCYC